MNKFRQFQQLLPQERRALGTVNQVRADGTTLVQFPDGRTVRARGTGIPVGSQAFVQFRTGQQPRLDGSAPNLPLSVFDDL